MYDFYRNVILIFGFNSYQVNRGNFTFQFLSSEYLFLLRNIFDLTHYCIVLETLIDISKFL